MYIQLCRPPDRYVLQYRSKRSNSYKITFRLALALALGHPPKPENLDDHFQFVVYGTSNKLNAYM